MKTEFQWIGWEGDLFHWDDFCYNSGDCYHSYRFGPILVKMFTEIEEWQK